MIQQTINLFGLRIDNLNYDDLIDKISGEIRSGSHVSIAYANAHVLNGIYRNETLKNTLSSFDIIHHDGIGAYLASAFLFGKGGFKKRFSGSDFYPLLASKAVENKWKVFFFGHDNKTLDAVRAKYPEMNICGTAEGYFFKNEDLIKTINDADADLLIIGMGFPKQEQWLLMNKGKINSKVSLVVGDGIKVFAGTKIRGPKLFRILGLEWLIRLFLHPLKYFKRYVFGNPLFLYRILNIKLANFTKNR
jgi:N-acetylglucosaminyldiphosphoundecaprenol N-acetyl-beta-D-mannosaminyltransferase